MDTSFTPWPKCETGVVWTAHHPSLTPAPFTKLCFTQTVMTITIMWLITITIHNHPVTPIITIQSCTIMWLLPHTFLNPYIPRPMPQSWYTMLHSCGALSQTCVPAYVHSLLHGIMFTPVFPCTFSTPIPMPHVFPSLYVTLCMTYAHLPCRILISPNTIMSSNLTCLSI